MGNCARAVVQQTSRRKGVGGIAGADLDEGLRHIDYSKWFCSLIVTYWSNRGRYARFCS
jgi:hypothetical protein